MNKICAHPMQNVSTFPTNTALSLKYGAQKLTQAVVRKKRASIALLAQRKGLDSTNESAGRLYKTSLKEEAC